MNVSKSGCRRGGAALARVIGGRYGLTPEFAGRHADVLREETREIAVIAITKFVGEFDQRTVRGAEQASCDGYPAAIQIMLGRGAHTAPELLKKPRAG